MFSMVVHVPQPPPHPSRWAHRARAREDCPFVRQPGMFCREPDGLKHMRKEKCKQQPSRPKDIEESSNDKRKPDKRNPPSFPYNTISLLRGGPGSDLVSPCRRQKREF